MKKIILMFICAFGVNAYAEDNVGTATPEEVEAVNQCFDFHNQLGIALDKTYRMQQNVLIVVDEFIRTNDQYDRLNDSEGTDATTLREWKNKRDASLRQVSRVAESGASLGSRTRNLKTTYDQNCKYRKFTPDAINQACKLPENMVRSQCIINKLG